MTSLNSKHLDMRSSNFIHNLLTHLDVLLCSQREAFSFCLLRFLVFKRVLFQPSASQRSGESLPLTGVWFTHLCWDSDLPHTRNELWIPHRLQLATAFSNFRSSEAKYVFALHSATQQSSAFSGLNICNICRTSSIPVMVAIYITYRCFHKGNVVCTASVDVNYDT